MNEDSYTRIVVGKRRQKRNAGGEDKVRGGVYAGQMPLLLFATPSTTGLGGGFIRRSVCLEA